MREEKIRCPNCGWIVTGEMRETWPFDSYYGHCEKCSYHILESEWDSGDIYYKLG